jgi:hypothetical protein
MADFCPYPVTGVVTQAVQQTTGQAILNWDPPTTNVDGSPLTDLGGYTVYMGPSAGNLSPLLDVTVNTHTQQGLPVGTHFFAVTAWDTETPRNESDLSNIVSKEIQ